MLSTIDKDFIQSIKKSAYDRKGKYILEQISSFHKADIAVLLEQLDSETGKYIFDILSPLACADILGYLEKNFQTDFLKLFSSKEIARFMDHISSDDAADILNEQSIKTREEVIALMKNKENAEYIVDLLPYKNDCAGGLMAKEFISANVNWNVKECIVEVRKQAKKIEKILMVYVVDNESILLGKLPLKKIIVSEELTLIKDIYNSDIKTVNTYQNSEEVASIMQKYNLEVVPVIDVRGRILGKITIDDIVDVITKQAEKEQQIMAGISEKVEVNDSIWVVSRSRVPWLIVGVLGGLLGAQFIGFFEEEIYLIPAMTFFIPLITATGGNVGIQSSTIIIQTLSSDSLSPLKINALSYFLKTMLIAIMNGFLIGLLVLISSLLFTNLKLSLTVSLALFCIVILSSFTGTLTPLLLRKIRIDPALASGPFITTANDLLGLLIYFLIARWLI